MHMMDDTTTRDRYAYQIFDGGTSPGAIAEVTLLGRPPVDGGADEVAICSGDDVIGPDADVYVQRVILCNDARR